MNVRLSKDQKIKVKSASDVYKVIQQIFLRENKKSRYQEHMWIIGLDNSNTILFVELISLGGTNRMVISTSEVFRKIIDKIATKFILVHNHPGKLVRPSEEDIKLTIHMVQAAIILQIALLDHLIITETEFMSIASLNLIERLSYD